MNPKEERIKELEEKIDKLEDMQSYFLVFGILSIVLPIVFNIAMQTFASLSYLGNILLYVAIFIMVPAGIVMLVLRSKIGGRKLKKAQREWDELLKSRDVVEEVVD